MARLMAHICRRDLLKPDSAALLLDMMRRCQTGQARIRGMLPAGTPVAHKSERQTAWSTTSELLRCPKRPVMLR